MHQIQEIRSSLSFKVVLNIIHLTASSTGHICNEDICRFRENYRVNPIVAVNSMIFHLLMFSTTLTFRDAQNWPNKCNLYADTIQNRVHEAVFGFKETGVRLGATIRSGVCAIKNIFPTSDLLVRHFKCCYILSHTTIAGAPINGGLGTCGGLMCKWSSHNVYEAYFKDVGQIRVFLRPPWP